QVSTMRLPEIKPFTPVATGRFDIDPYVQVATEKQLDKSIPYSQITTKNLPRVMPSFTAVISEKLPEIKRFVPVASMKVAIKPFVEVVTKQLSGITTLFAL